MMIRRGATALALLCTLAPAATAQEFEGTVRQRMVTAPLTVVQSLIGGDATDAELVFALPIGRLLEQPRSMMPGEGVQVVEITIHAKGGKRRVEVAMPGSPIPEGLYSIIDSDARVMHSVIPPLRAVMSMELDGDGPAAEAMKNAMAAASASAAEMRFADAQLTTIEPRTLLGYEARGYEARGEKIHVRGWAAPALKGFAAVDMPGMPSMPVDPVSAMGAEGLLMLTQVLMLTELQGGAGTAAAFTMPPSYMVTEVLSIEQGTLDASLFEVPADYERIRIRADGGVGG